MKKATDAQAAAFHADVARSLRDTNADLHETIENLRAQLATARADAIDLVLRQEEGCEMTYCGGYTGSGDGGRLDAFRHGMTTVFNVVRSLKKGPR